MLRLFAVLALLTVSATAQVTSPEEHLGRPVGVDFELVDWDETSSYFKLLANQSPRVVTQREGTTTEGREFLITVISSESNLADLDAIKARARVLADPRGADERTLKDAVENGRVILFIANAMHSTETAATQFGMEFAWKLATSDEEPWRSARQELVIVMFPCLNPDGLDHVTDWYRQTVGTPYEASGLLKLYQYYSGHDNNRDWFMLTQNETRIVTRLLYSEWFPTVYWDVHQQGSTRERFFVPPYRDPLNPNLDPAIITGIDVLGSRALHDLTREGFTGVSTGVSYDMWWNGGNRNVPVRHNIMGLLTEAASVRLATPVFLPLDRLSPPRGLESYAPSNRFPDPWPGGWWRLRDIIEYELAFGRSLMGSLIRERKRWLTNALETSLRTIERGRKESPRAWIVPSDNRDPDAVRRLIDTIMLGGVEVHVSDDPLEADGRSYPAGSIVVQRDQPYGNHVKDLFDVQRYPDGPPPYDVSGWTLPFLLGVRRVEVMHGIEGDFRLASSPGEAVAAFRGDERAGQGELSTRHGSSWTHLAAALGEGEDFAFTTEGDRAGLLVPGLNLATSMRGMPRIGLYAPWYGSMDEGWMRYALDSTEIPHVRVRNEMLRAGDLEEFLDVLIIASISSGQLDRGRSPGSVPDAYTRGLDPEGAVAVEEFVRQGGTLVTVGSSSRWAIDLMEIPLGDASRDDPDFSCPGSVVRCVPGDDPLTADLPQSIPVFFSGSMAFREMTSEERRDAGRDEDWELDVMLRYAPSRVLLSGWIRAPETIEGRAAWIRARYGSGQVHLFGFRPQYRGWSSGAYGLLYRAIFLASQ